MHGKDLSIHKKVLDFIISTLHFLYLGGGGYCGLDTFSDYWNCIIAYLEERKT